MWKAFASAHGTTTDYTVLKLPLVLGSLALTILPLLLPLYAKRLGASAIGIGGLFAIAQCMLVLLRPVIGWAIDRYGRKAFFVAGVACYAGAMGVFAAARSVPVLYLAQLIQGLATALTWTAAYTIATDLAPSAQQGQAIGRVDEYTMRGALAGMVVTLAFLSRLSLRTAWVLLFVGYASLAVGGVWLAVTQTPETRPSHPTSVPSRPLVSGPLLRVMGVVFLSHGCMTVIQPVFLVFLQDHVTTDVRLLVLAFLPATLIDSFLPARMGGLSDRWGRVPLIVAGLTWAGLCALMVPGVPHLAWASACWTLQTLGLTMAVPSQKALISDMTTHTVRGTGYGLYTFAAGGGATVGPLLGGWLYDAIGHTAPFALTGVVLLASAGWGLLLLRRTAP
jgi:DHA1 family multidrug resistance protein-like MFS transporter